MASSTQIPQSPDYGARQLHQTLDYLSKVSPGRLYASIPRSSDLSEGFRDITFQDMARCSDFVAHWIQDNIGKSTRFETICYIGVPDLRSVAVFFGSLKCGYKVLFPSPRNPPATNASLLEQTQCSIVLHAEEVGPIVKQLHSVRTEIRCLAIPSFQTILEGDGRSFFYEGQTFQEAKNNPIVVLHSSGSTGIPKPITMTHGTFAVLDNERNISGVSGRRKRDFSVWDFQGVNPTFTEASSPVLGPPLLPPSGSLLKEIMKHQKLRALYIPPAIAEQLLQEPGGIEFFRGLDFLCYTGAPFSPAAGKQLVEVTELCSLYGSTEAFQVPQLIPESKDDWAYMEWNPNFKLEMQPSEDENGAYEMVLFTDESTEAISALNHNLPGVTEWRTKDLFKPHPTKQNLWNYYGRRDDIIVLSNSEKFNPVPMELMIQGHPLLAGALVIGNGKIRASLLLEPKPHVQGDEKGSLIKTLWPRIEEANTLVPGHGRILISNIIVADKPFSRAGKGTIVRKLTEQTFKEEIDSLYSQTKLLYSDKIPTLKATFERQSVLQFVCSIVVSCFPAAVDAADSEDLFSHGLDSLKINELVATLKSGIAKHVHSSNSNTSWISPEMIYQNPTIDQLVTVFYNFLNSRKIPNRSNTQARISNMEELVRKYTRDLPVRSESNPVSVPLTSEICVAITGSTGTLGTAILCTLLSNKKISRIYCLNRNPSARQFQETLLLNRGIPRNYLSKLQFLTINLSSPSLNLSPSNLSLLLQDVDIILNNAWKVDFNLALRSFETPYIESVRHVIDMSVQSRKGARIYFVSSVSAVMETKEVIGEEVLGVENFERALGLGYAESKRVAEEILGTASREVGVPVTILRVGQIGGSANPNDPPWPRQEWLYPVLQASKTLGLIASKLAPIDWLPIDKVAHVITDIISSNETPKSPTTLQVFNIVNPTPVPWTLFVSIQQDRFGKQAKIIPLQDWVREMDIYSSSHEAHEIVGPTLKPALRMIKQLGDGKDEIKYATEQSVAISKTLAEMKPIDKAILEMWLDQWGL
ncbi:hypothetical protein NHQ30_005345 [Ciborinia camelliae]|nr:hypothetical protein NHQ30_005345 [Ciborinia camelliae]